MINLIKSTFYKETEMKKSLCAFIKKANQLSMGDKCAQFEKEFAIWQNRKFCAMFNSGSSANLALIQSLINIGRLKKGDKVGFSAITWATNVMPLIQLGLTPVPIDIEKETLNTSKEKIAEIFKHQKIKAIFITNLLGFSDDIEAIKKFSNQNKIILLEDNCESLGSEFKKKKLGNFGIASTFSFFVGHHLSTIEGGAICTDNKKLYEAMIMTRAHGWDRNLEKNTQSEMRQKQRVDSFYAKYTFYDLGYNLRPTEIQGFLGIKQLKLIDKIIDIREKNYQQFTKIYSNNDFIKTKSLLNRFSNFAFPVICKSEKLQRHYIKKCLANKIEVRPIVGGLMTEQPFFKKYIKNSKQGLCANARFIHQNGFYFGNNPDMTQKEIQHIINTLKYE